MQTTVTPAPWETHTTSVLGDFNINRSGQRLATVIVTTIGKEEGVERQIAALPDLMAFVEQMARMTTPEDEFEDDSRDYGSPEDMVADFDDARLCGEYQAFMHKVREARAVLTKARGQVL